MRLDADLSAMGTWYKPGDYTMVHSDNVDGLVNRKVSSRDLHACMRHVTSPATG